MGMFFNHFRAGGDINPARFVTGDTSANHQVVESNSGDTKIIGITAENTKNAPQTGGSTLHAEAGDMTRVHGYGEDPLLEIGSGGVTAFDFIKPDNDGKGVTSSTTGETAAAIALESASAGELAKVLVISPYHVP